jgi:adhesin transport system membrane fusion protein
MGSESHPLKIIPGMTAGVDILTGDKSVDHCMLKPVLRARDNAMRER